MSKLKKYTNFEALKSDAKPDKAVSPKDEDLLAEFKSFITLLQQQFSTNQQTKSTRGKQIS